jgi:uncharacterized membrane-anchored protein YitT (DUF2179 family)
MARNVFKEYAIVAIGSLILALVFNAILLPLEIVAGGSTGLSILGNHFFGIAPALIVFICYAGALLCGRILLGKKKIKKSVFGSMAYPLLIYVTSPITDVVKSIPLNNDEYLILVIMGAIVSGIAFGLVYKVGCTTGGSDIAAQIINKYFGLRIGSANTLLNVIIVISGGVVFGWDRVLYAILTLYIIGIATDRILLGVAYSKKLYIITDKDDEVKQYIFKEFKQTVTEIDAIGGYSNHSDQVLMCVVPTRDYFKLKEGISVIDDKAFFIVTDAYELNNRA